MHVAMMALGSAAGQFFHGHDAAFQLAASDVFKLNRGVLDEKVVMKNVVEFDSNADTLGGWNIGNCDVAGKGAGVRA